jgi:hypothetical protein
MLSLPGRAIRISDLATFTALCFTKKKKRERAREMGSCMGLTPVYQ